MTTSRRCDAEIAADLRVELVVDADLNLRWVVRLPREVDPGVLPWLLARAKLPKKVSRLLNAREVETVYRETLVFHLRVWLKRALLTWDTEHERYTLSDCAAVELAALESARDRAGLRWKGST